MAKTRKSLTEAADKELKTAFSLDKFKANKGLASNVKFKEQKWIPFSPALQEALSIPGIPMGHNSMVRGKSNTGKSTTTIEIAVNAQKMGVLPVLIITEMKHDWEHWKKMGFQIDDVVDETTGEITDQTGFFIYRDRSTLNSIEDIASFIIDLLTEQKKGNLPYDLLFIWDSVGSIPCQMSIEQGKNNPMWNAGAIATQFGNFINQQIVMSRKESSKYTNTLFIVNKVGVAPALTPMSQPRMTNKGGDTFYYDVSLCLTFGNVTNAGTSKISAVKDKKKVEFALRTKISCDKNHINGITTMGTIVSTVHGFIKDDPLAIKKYKDEYSHEWAGILGTGTYGIDIDESEWEEKKDISDLFEPEDLM
jgi:RecA/RadA recombinase